MSRTLIIRFSAFGDVAMAIPVVYSIATRYPHDEFTFLTKDPFQSIFINKPNNLQIIPIYPGENRKIRNLIFNHTYNLADLHAVLRSFSIDLYYKLIGTKVAIIHKGRKEKKLLTRTENKQLYPLTTTIERYQKVFENLGYDASLNFTSLFESKNKKNETWIGIAPFARHQGKTYPIKQMEHVVKLLSNKDNLNIFLFGGKNEKPQLKNWSLKYKNVQSIAGQLSMEDELRLINDLDIMVSMDSANMHLASLVNTPVISIWGATHPYAGFYGYKQSPDNAVQINLSCRPCSVFGNKPCIFRTYDCFKQITPEMIVEKVEKYIKFNNRQHENTIQNS